MTDRDLATDRPEPGRRLRVRGTWAYADRLAVEPGGTLRFHVGCESAHEVSVVRLGREAILRPGATQADELADVEPLASAVHADASPAMISAGSYVFVDGPPLPDGPVTMGCWLRLWRLPVIDEVQWAWSGILSDLDYPEASRAGLLVDHAGRLCLYAGDGGVFDHRSMLVSESLLVGDQLGRWVHVAGILDGSGARISLDGTIVAHDARSSSLPSPTTTSRLRIGATAEGGRADDFLDGDIAAPFVASRALEGGELHRVVADRGRSPMTSFGVPLHAAWDLAEERGAHLHDASGNGRHGTLVQGGTWQIGGPAFDASRGGADDDPLSDPDRGHGLRLSSDDLLDCEWPVSDEWRAPDDADSGLYAALVRPVGAAPDDAVAVTFVVSRRTPRQAGSVALLAATNTWVAYGRRPRDEDPVAGLSASYYSTHVSGRPFFSVSMRAPIPRADPFGYESERAARQRHSHLVRPERFAEAWLAHEGYPYEVITDLDLHEEPELLARFGALMVVGHSEYWSDEARDGVEAYLAAGGKVVSLSGNTLFWRVSYDPRMIEIESRKAVAADDPRWLAPPMWGERWHAHDGLAGSHFPLLDRHGYRVLGLDTHGMVDDGTPTSFGPLTVLAPDHPLLHEPETVPLSPGGTIGEASLNGPRASGYEFDTVPEELGYRSEPLPGLTILASALDQRNIEWGGDDSAHWGGGVDRDRGADCIIWHRPDGGRVFALGSIGASGALAADPGVGALVRNVLADFGIPRVGGRVSAGHGRRDDG